jgi:hypothetical protein
MAIPLMTISKAYNQYKAMYNPLSKKLEGQKEVSLMLPESEFRYGRRNRYFPTLPS